MLRNKSFLQVMAASSMLNVTRLAINTIAWLILVPVILNLLGEELFGIWTLVTSALAVAGVLDLGMSASATKFMSEFKAAGKSQEMSEALSIALTIQLLFGILGGGLLFVLAPNMPAAFGVAPENISATIWSFRIAAIGLPLSILRAFTATLPTVVLRYDVSNALMLGFTITTAVATVLVATYSQSVESVLLATVLTIFGFTLLGVVACRSIFPDIHIHIVSNRETWKRMLGFSGHATLASIAGRIFMYADKIIVGMVLGPAAAGYYSIAVGFGAKINQVGAAIANALLPAFSALQGADADREKLARLFMQVHISYSTIIFYLGSIAFVLSVPFFEMWLSKTATQDIKLLLQAAIIAYTLFSLSATSYFVVYALNLPQFNSGLISLGSILSLTLIYIFSKFFGLAGAGFGNLGYVVVLGLMIVVFKHLKIRFIDYLVTVWQPMLLFVVAMAIEKIWPADSLFWAGIYSVGISMLFGPILYKQLKVKKYLTNWRSTRKGMFLKSSGTL